ncbi:[NiFe]-hydrogenase assembly chaperone HybE [Sulfurivirga sp.]|uniref:[NiFe]-hydrogenase assembly chaperone HybE n=1 Tax=Sulfurivirga sp. TaxID=2614236 RepID=UPI0025EC4246|nr:[NiFe]-hydrogenase assembly chaperone HybE [Sulfurivirga sp.]
MTSDWQTLQAHDLDDAHAALEEAFRTIERDSFRDDLLGGMALNAHLNVEIRGLRRVDDWVVAFVLTPWMLAQVFCPLEPPHLPLPDDWRAEARGEAPYVVIGPPMRFQLGGQPFQAFLNYHPRLGHYLVQPLVQSMGQYADNEAAFAAWAEVLRFRREQYERMQAEADARAERAARSELDRVSRRDFLRRWRAGSAD